MSITRTIALLALVASSVGVGAGAVSPVSGNNYTISPISFPSLCLAAGGTTEGSAVVTSDCDTADDIVWTYNGGTFVNTATNMCVDITDGNNYDGNKLQLWGCYANNRNQAFAPSTAATGENIKWSGVNKCWDLTDGSSATGNHIQIWTCFTDNTNQRWDFVDAEEVESCDATTSTSAALASATSAVVPSASASASTSLSGAVSANVSASASASVSVSNSSASASASSAPASLVASVTASSTASAASASASDCSDDPEYEECYIGEVGCEEVGSNSTTSVNPSSTASLNSTASANASANVTASITASINATASITASASASASASGLGGDLLAGGHASSSSASSSSSSSSKNHKSSSSSSAWSASATASASAYASSSGSVSAWGSSTSGKASASASASGSAASSASSAAVSAGTGSTSGYLTTSGTKVVDGNGNTVVLRGTNLGGWLVFEDWMCGISDESGNSDREAQVTLESRFGLDQTKTLMNAWQDNWLVSSDFDNIASLGFNLVRLPFSYRNFKWSNGSYITDASGNVDFSRLDWAVAQAKSRGIYVIPVYHIWEGQVGQGTSDYSTISETGSAGDAERAEAAELWGMIAEHFVGETTIAGYDVMNEVTGSPGDILQIAMYNAIRAKDPNRLLIMESVSANPSSHGWTNVMYSMHEYNMMGSDLSSNEAAYASGIQAAIDQANGFNIPMYMGEAMWDGATLDYAVQQMDAAGIWWSSWTYTTANMGRWGLWNFGSSLSVDVSSDSYNTILSAWSSMGSKSKQSVASQYQSDVKRRSLPEERATESPRAGHVRKIRGSAHGGRSRRAGSVRHGSK